MPDPIDNQVVANPDPGLSEKEEIITDPESSPAQEPTTQLSEIDQIIADLPEDKREIVREGILRNKDYTQGKQSIADQRRMNDRTALDNKQKIEFYDTFVNDKELRKQMALQEGFVEPKSEKAINKKALELIENMNPDEKATIDYIVDQAIEKRLGHVDKFIDDQNTNKQKNRQEKQNEVFSDFVSTHKDYAPNNEIDIAMKKKSDALGFDFKTMPIARIKVALNTLYKSVTADVQVKLGKIAATKNILKTNTVARKNSERSNSGISPNVSKGTPKYETMDDMFEDLF